MSAPQVDERTGEILDYFVATDEQLIEAKAASEQAVKNALSVDGKVDQELLGRAAERGATTIYGKEHNFEIKTPNDYDRTKLPRLLELLTPDEKAKCFIPAHQETVDVPDKHDMTQWKKAARAHGGELQEGLDDATFPGRASGKLVQTEPGIPADNNGI